MDDNDGFFCYVALEESSFRLLARLLVSLFAAASLIGLLLMLHLAVHHCRCYDLLMLININAAAHVEVVVSLACSIACVVVCTDCVAADAASCCSPLALLCFADADQYQMLLLMLKLLGNATPVVMVLPLT
jgi:hypothetical protein